ncbi:MAG: hypothetical protein SVX43_07145 [Cyanobacteriota bacterium]|nr:hypothetical protein [Cyanobacteriota bacterium]
MIRIEGTRKQQSDFHSILRPRDRISQSAAVINPISWSSDSRYLLVRIDFLEGYDGYSEHLILDARNNYRLVNFQSNSLFSPCNNAQMGSEFLGFISTDIALFECRNYGEPGYVEVLNLNQRALQRVNGFGEDRRLQHYGTILSLPDIVKVQEFPAR